MKVRAGFVSNSSSSSFVVSKHFISECQLELIRDHVEVAERNGWFPELGWPEPWYISENEHEIEGDTMMNNFDMELFLEKIGVDMSKVRYHHDG